MGSDDEQVRMLGVVLQNRMMVEVEERLRVFKTAAEAPPGQADERLRAVVREAEAAFAEFLRVGVDVEGARDRFVRRLRRAQLELRLLHLGWPRGPAWLVSRVWPVRWLPVVLVEEM